MAGEPEQEREPLRRRLARLLARLVGLALIVLVLWSAGWSDRVVDAEGEEHVGRILERGDARLLLRTDAGERSFATARVLEVRAGLAGAFARLGAAPGLALVGVLLHLASLALCFARWGLLLAGADLAMPWTSVVRLAWVGQFFGSVLPGGLGSGDLVKALYVAHAHAGHRTRAIVTVFVDRGLGLLVLCLLATAAVIVAPTSSRIPAVRVIVLGLLALGLVVAALLLSGRARAALGLDRVAPRLPFQRIVRELGEAGRVYGRRPSVIAGALLLSLLAHGCTLCAFTLYAGAMGTWLPLLAVGAAIPVAQMLAAIPALPGGWGVGDAAFLVFLPAAGVAAGQAVALSICWRLVHTVISLPGALWLAGARAAVHAD